MLQAQDVSGRMQQTAVLVATVNRLHAFILSHFFLCFLSSEACGEQDVTDMAL